MRLKTLACAISLSLASSVISAQTLHSVSVHSNAYQNKEAINAILSPYMGKEIDIKLLQTILNEVSRYYHNIGYTSSQAFYPDQSTVSGDLLIEIAHPRLSNLNFKNLASLNSFAMSTLFNGLKSYQGQYFSEEDLTNQLYKLNDLGQFSLLGSYSAGAQNDSVDLNLTIDPVRKLNFVVFADNYGTKSSGRIRGGTQINVNNLTGSADVLSFFYARSQEKQNNFNLSYEIPVSSHPTVLGTSLCLSDYELAGEYKVLGAQGKSLNYDIYLREPVFRNHNTKINVTGGARYRRISDEFKTFDVEFKKHSFAGFLSAESLYAKNKVELSGKLSFTVGHLENDDEWELYDDSGFSLTNFEGMIGYRCSKYVTLRDTVSFQIGSNDLESSERFIPAGAEHLSAYDSNILSGDSGILNSFAFEISPNPNFNLKISPHFDGAYVHSNGYDSEKIFGTGIKIDFKKDGFFINSSFDFPVGHKPTADTDDFKIFLRAGYHYA